MSIRSRFIASIACLSTLLLLASCAVAPTPEPAAVTPLPPREPPAPVVHTTAAGPVKGFSITQELTSEADVLWEADLPVRGQVRETRGTGLRILALFEVTERGGSTAVIKATMKKTEIRQGGGYIPAPFLQFNPPQVITFKVNYQMRLVEFSAAQRAYEEWANSLKGTPVWEVMSAVFSVNAYVTQLKDLFGRTALDFAGNTYAFRRTITEKKPFYVPLLGAGISLGPIDMDLSSTLRYVEVGPRGKIFRIHGEQNSKFLRLDAASLSARLQALGAQAPPHFENEGLLKGTVEAQVDAASGWTTELFADFTSVINAGFSDGQLTETVTGRRIVETR